MTSKFTGKSQSEQPEQPDNGPSQEDLQVAYQAHTLAHMLYGQLATIHPWIPPASPMAPRSGMGLGMIDPTMGPLVAPWGQSWAGFYGNPVHPGSTGVPFMGTSCFFGSDFIPR